VASVRVMTDAGDHQSAEWRGGCRCDQCRRKHADRARTLGRARAQKRLPVKLRERLLDAIYAGQPFRKAVRDLGLTANRVWGLAKTDEAWSGRLDAALTATRREDLRHGTTPAYVLAPRVGTLRLQSPCFRTSGRSCKCSWSAVPGTLCTRSQEPISVSRQRARVSGIEQKGKHQRVRMARKTETAEIEQD
jgi:hypothetical protein